MTGRLIWVTGRAAAGKSTVLSQLANQLRTLGFDPAVFNDEQLLLGLVRADSGHRHHEHPGRDTRRIRFTSGHLFDESLRLLNRCLIDQIATDDAIALVELARGRHAPPVDVTYRRALELIDERVWSHSTVIRLGVDFNEQLARNASRRGLTGLGTPDDVMHRLYSDDDPHSFTNAGIVVHQLPSADPASTAQQIATIAGVTTRTQYIGRRRVVSH